MTTVDSSKELLLNAAIHHWMHDLAAQGILITDDELNVVGWNVWLEERTGRRTKDMIGGNLLELYPDLVERRLHRYYKWALEGQVRLLSHRLHGHLLAIPAVAGSNRYAQMQQSVRISPLVQEGRTIGTITIIDDVTERVTREAELQAQIEARSQLLISEKLAREEAENANRLKDQFLATMSHELRTPLTAIIGWSNILRRGNMDPATSVRALETIHRNAHAQNQLVSDLLDVSRIISGKLRLEVQTIELAGIVDAALDGVRPAADAKGISIQAFIDPEAGQVAGDSDRLQQVIWNLLSNAIKFTPKNGQVFIRLERANGQVEISVSDTGVGISADFLPFVFDRFRQADAATTRAHGGLGLGLSIVRQLTELHGGTVRVESEGEGKGSVFTISLPLIEGQKSIDGPGGIEPGIGVNAPSFDYPDSLRGLKVLAIDDEEDTRDLLRAVLEECGSRVMTASSAAEALPALASFHPDVLISDLGMPGEDGYSLIATIRALPPDRGGRTPAVALTAYATTEDRMRAIRSGFQIHLAKPVEPAELITVVAQVVEKFHNL